MLIIHRSPHLLVLFLLATIFIRPAAAQTPELFEWTTSGTTMGSVAYSIKCYSNIDPRRGFGAAIEKSLTLVNNRMSTYQADSEVSRFNASRHLDWFPISAETAQVIARALEISRASNGAFDITVGPLVKLWNFGPDKSEFVVPSQEQINQYKQRIGYQQLTLRLTPPALKKAHPELEIDLSAIAKGFAVDLLARELQLLGLESYLVELGGEVRARGHKPDGSPWIVGIESPHDGSRSIYRRIELTDRSLASSGDYRQFHIVGGQRYSHTIDPRTGQPVAHQLAAVSVVADDCMTADALATALMVLGPDDLSMVTRFGAEALAITRSPGGFSEVQTTDFPPAAVDAKPNNFVRTLVAAAVIFLVAVVAMSVGVIFSGRRLRGSCGGIAALDNPDVSADCAVCSAPTSECRELKKEMNRRGRTNAT